MDPSIVKQDAKAMLEGRSFDPRKLALLHTGVMVIFSLLAGLISQLLDHMVNGTGGLSGVAMRSALESGQAILSMAISVLTPFWQIGFIFAALELSNKQEAAPSSLLEGFRRFGPVLRMYLLVTLVFAGVVLACAYLANMIFTFSPMSDKYFAEGEALLKENPEITEQMMMQLMPYTTWLFVVFGALLLIIGLPLYYRYRMCEYTLLDGASGARQAIHQSKLLSLHNRWNIFRFDLSFWWYHLAGILISAIAYGDQFLKAFKVNLPVSDGVLFWGFYLISLAAQVLFVWRFGAYYHTSCALYYRRLKERFLTPITPPPSGTDYE